MTRRKDGRLQEVITIDGKRRYFYGKTKREIELQKLAFSKERELGKPFREVADEWWVHYSPKLAENSLQPCKAAYNFTVEAIGDKRIGKMRPCDISRAIDTLADRGLTTKTIKRYLSTFSLIFKYAVRKGYCDINIARDVTIDGGKESNERTAPTSDEIALVKKLAHDEPYAMMCVWVLYSGLRRGELMALDREDVDLRNRRIRVSKSVTKNGNIKSPKTKASFGFVPINDALMEYIDLPEAGAVFQKNGTRYTGKMIETERRHFAEKYKMQATLHCFRHATSDLCIESGMNAVETQAILRHAHADISIDTYASKRKEFTDKTFEKFKAADIG